MFIYYFPVEANYETFFFYINSNWCLNKRERLNVATVAMFNKQNVGTVAMFNTQVATPI